MRWESKGNVVGREAKMAQSSRRESSSSNTRSRREVARLEDIPNVGPAVAADLRRVGIKSLGEFKIPLRLHREVTAEITLNVVKEAE